MSGQFDPAAAWRAIDEAARERLGIALVVYFAAMQAGGDGSPGLGPKEAQRWGTAETEALVIIEQLVPHLTAEEIIAGPDLAPLGLRACTVCGCTDDIGCDPPCRWVGPTLCSSCGSEVPT